MSPHGAPYRVSMKMVQVKLGQILLEAIEYNQEDEVNVQEIQALHQQFKEDAVIYVRDHPDLSLNEAAGNLGIAASTLGKWIKRADGADEGGRFDPPILENICLMFQLPHGCPLFRPPSLLV